MASKLSILRAQVLVTDTCAWCESIHDVKWYCNDCQEALCDRCFEGHQRARKTRNDSVVPIQEGDKPRGIILPDVCKTHSGKTCDLYCCDCNIVMCAMCFTENHRHHAFKNIEEKIISHKRYLQDQLKLLKSKSSYFNDKLTKRHKTTKSFKDSADVVRESIETQRLKLKAEIDSIADSVLVELSSLVEKEEKSHNLDSQSYNKYIKEINEFIIDIEEKTEYMSSTSFFEFSERLRTTIPLYDVAANTLLPCLPRFVPGDLNQCQLRTMFGYFHDGKWKKYSDDKQAHQFSTLQVPHQNQINSICSIDDTHAWMSLHGSTELIKVNKEGKMSESVRLDVHSGSLALTNTEELLITCFSASALIYKLSKERRVSLFTDISPLKARGISVSDSNEAFVTTGTTTILVLNMSGERIRQISCGACGRSIVCLTTGDIVVTTGPYINTCRNMVVINKTGQIIHRWNGELTDGQKMENMVQCDISRDRYDRVYVPDYNTHQIYVISGNERKAKCLLDKHYGVKRPLTVCVDRCGHVWIGCGDGTLHVIEYK